VSIARKGVSIARKGVSIARKGVSIAAGVAAAGECERMNKKGMRGGAMYVVSRWIQSSAEFEHYCNGISVAGEVNEVFKLINICLYIPFGLEVPI
jgi:hypothetical protein